MAYTQDPTNDTSVKQLSGMGFPSGGPQLGGAEQFFLEEWDAAKARGQGNPFAGFTIPGNVSGADFFAIVSLAEQFAQNTGQRFFPSPQLILAMAANGWSSADKNQVFYGFAQAAGILTTQPWAAWGLSHSQWNQASQNLDESVTELTGQSGWDAAGLDPNQKNWAIGHGWSSADLTSHLQRDPNVLAKYGWIKHGMNYQAFQEYKTTNAAQLRERYGNQVNDTLAVNNLDKPLAEMHGTGAQVQNQQASKEQAGAHDTTGNQSEIR